MKGDNSYTNQFYLLKEINEKQFHDVQIPKALILAADREGLSSTTFVWILYGFDLMPVRFIERIGTAGIDRLFRTYTIMKNNIRISWSERKQERYENRYGMVPSTFENIVSVRQLSEVYILTKCHQCANFVLINSLLTW